MYKWMISNRIMIYSTLHTYTLRAAGCLLNRATSGYSKEKG